MSPFKSKHDRLKLFIFLGVLAGLALWSVLDFGNPQRGAFHLVAVVFWILFGVHIWSKRK